MKKRIIALLLCGLVLTGCGQSQTDAYKEGYADAKNEMNAEIEKYKSVAEEANKNAEASKNNADDAYKLAYDKALKDVTKEDREKVIAKAEKEAKEQAKKAKSELKEELRDEVKEELKEELEPEVRNSLEEAYTQETKEISGVYKVKSEGTYLVSIAEKYFNKKYSTDQLGGQEAVLVYKDIDQYRKDKFDFEENAFMNKDNTQATVYAKKGNIFYSDKPYTVKKVG